LIPAPFRPRFPWFGPDLQTLRNALARAPKGPEGERLEFQVSGGDMLVGALDRAGTAGTKPLAVLVHGLTGCATSAYMRATSCALRAAGHDVLRLNLRGAGPTRTASRESYHAGRSEDLRAVLAALPGELVAVGYSLGANMLLKFLGEEGAGGRIRAAATVSAPLDLAASSRRLHAPRNRVYHDYLLRRMIADSPYAEARAPGIATIRDFDDRVVARLNGFANADDYYARCSSRAFLPAIRTRTLLVHAADDPWIPGKLYADYDWAANPHLTPCLTRGGGHVGFHEAGHAMPRHDREIVAFFGTIS
jgi:predicted alpha/beta-fold hydrolase